MCHPDALQPWMTTRVWLMSMTPTSLMPAASGPKVIGYRFGGVASTR
jgi:hypothetical protein